MLNRATHFYCKYSPQISSKAPLRISKFFSSNKNNGESSNKDAVVVNKVSFKEKIDAFINLGRYRN